MTARMARSDVAGVVWKVVAAAGDRIAAGDTIMLIESMKMEIPVLAETGGIVREILLQEKAEVAEGQAVAVIEVD